MVPEVNAGPVQRGIPVPPLDADLQRGWGVQRGSSWNVRWALPYEHKSPSVRGHRPGRVWGTLGIQICIGLEPSAGGAAPGGGREAELHLPLDHVIHRDPKSRRVWCRDGISLPAAEEEGGET